MSGLAAARDAIGENNFRRQAGYLLPPGLALGFQFECHLAIARKRRNLTPNFVSVRNGPQ